MPHERCTNQAPCAVSKDVLRHKPMGFKPQMPVYSIQVPWNSSAHAQRQREQDHKRECEDCSHLCHGHNQRSEPFNGVEVGL